ncbi:MAG: CNNM domain-containing protein [Candidatus Peribacteraceae bacterium]|jgi:CBS domain containing-hemolysin-like protein
MTELILLVITFVALSGLLSLLDAAIISLHQAEVEEVAARHLYGGGALRRLMDRQMRAVIMLVILTNAVNILGPVVIGVRATLLFGNQVLGVLTAVLTALTILFSEIIPKALGTRHAPAVARFSAPILLAVILVFSPVVSLIEWMVKPFRKGERPVGTEEQIRALVKIGARRGLIEEDEQRMIARTFFLNDRTAADIMIPRERMVAFAPQTTMRGAADIAAKALHHRYPVIGPGPDEVRGFVMSRDILQALVEGRGEDSVMTIVHEPVLVSSRMRADAILEVLRGRRLHLAVVRDDGHKVVGIVTLHEILEELVGDMQGEMK